MTTVSPSQNVTTTPQTAKKTVRLHIKRQNKPEEPSFWEEFQVPYVANMNVISCLQEIQRNPVNAEGKKVNPVVWDCNCLEEVCGACTMVINNKVQQSCSSLVDKLEQPIKLEPMSSFPVIRDLSVDRSRMFENLKRVHAWVELDGSYNLGAGPKMADSVVQMRYLLSTCMTCGACLEACPNFGQDSAFMGPQIINAVRLFNTHPTGALQKDDRLEALMGTGGIAMCGSSQNCVRACPKEIPLTESIAEMNRQVNRYAIMRLFKR